MTARTGPNGADDQSRGQGHGQHLDTETLSAYLDDELHEPVELARVRAHLASCESCRRDLAELRAVAVLLGEQLLPEAPRSFRLTPAMVIPSQPAEPAAIPWVIRVQPALRRLTALAAVLLVVVVTSDLVVHSRAQGTTAPTQAVTALRTESGAASTSAAAAPAPYAARSAADQAGRPTEIPRATAASAAKAAPPPAASPAAAQPQAAVSGSAAGEAATPASAPNAAPADANRAEAATPASAAPSPGSTPGPGESATAAPFAAGAQSSATQSGESTAPAAPEPSTVTSGQATSFSFWRPLELILGTLVVISFAAMLTLPRLRADTSRNRH